MAIRRTGQGRLLKLAKLMCRLVGAFTPAIQARYPTNIALQTALQAANVACAELASQLEAVKDLGD